MDAYARPRSRLSRYTLLATTLISVCLLVWVSLEARDVRADFQRLYDRATGPYPGMYVPVWPETTLDGDDARIGDVAAGHAQVLFFFTTTCEFCRVTVPVWTRLAEEVANNPRVDVYGVALDSVHATQAYALEHALPFPTVVLSEPRYSQLFRVRGVPLSMVIEEHGRVRFAHIGELTDPAVIDSIRAALRGGESPPESLRPTTTLGG